MRAAERQPAWTEANQAYLVAEFARLKQRLAGESVESLQIARDALENRPPSTASASCLD